MSAKNKAVFLDRDGVLNHEQGDYICRVEDFIVLDNYAALKTLQDKGYMLIVATNQGGMAKGWYSEDELAKMHTKNYVRLIGNMASSLPICFIARTTPTLQAIAIAANPNRVYYCRALKNITSTHQNHTLLATVSAMLKQAPPQVLKGILIDSDQPISTVLDMIA
jgi:D-glycero-D-manno-heptose 1,7-bisphosphate phosphatase